MSKNSVNAMNILMKNSSKMNYRGKINCGYLMQFDGGSRGNPGISGCGAVIYNSEGELWNCKNFLGLNQTNNYAEYMGLINGLKGALDMNIKELNVEGDSQMIIKQMTGEYKAKSPNIIPLYQEAIKLRDEFDSIAFTHIYRKQNSRADELANIAMDYKK